MNTSEVLNRAADLIEERGWSVGNGWADEGDGHPLCVEGGIAAAMGVRGGPGFRCPAYDAVRDYIGISPWIWNDHLMQDRINKAFVRGEIRNMADLEIARVESREWATREVIATLRAAALVESAKETAAEPVTQPESVSV